MEAKPLVPPDSHRAQAWAECRPRTQFMPFSSQLHLAAKGSIALPHYLKGV